MRFRFQTKVEHCNQSYFVLKTEGQLPVLVHLNFKPTKISKKFQLKKKVDGTFKIVFWTIDRKKIKIFVHNLIWPNSAGNYHNRPIIIFYMKESLNMSLMSIWFSENYSWWMDDLKQNIKKIWKNGSLIMSSNERSF